MPLWVGMFSAFRGRHPSRLEWLGLGVGFAGVVWLNLGSAMSASVPGMLALLAATLSWAYGSVWSHNRDLAAPFMTISFLALSVIPDLKLTDRGLVDVPNFRLVPLEVG